MCTYLSKGVKKMTIQAHSPVTIESVDAQLRSLEASAGLSTDELLTLEQGDPRLEAIDEFDRLDWYYLVEQKKALEASRFECDIFRYSSSKTLAAVDMSEMQLGLVA
jgi:hypothetical protein